MRTFALALLALMATSALCSCVAREEEIAATKTELIPLRQACEESLFTDNNGAGTSCFDYWTKVRDDLNNYIGDHYCWLSDRFASIDSLSTSTTLADDVIPFFDTIDELFGFVLTNFVADEDEEECCCGLDEENPEVVPLERILAQQLVALSEALSAMGDRLIASASDNTKFTDDAELIAAVEYLDITIRAAVDAQEALTKADVQEQVDAFEAQIVSDGADPATTVEARLKGLIETFKAEVESTDDAITTFVEACEQDLVDLELEFFLALCPYDRSKQLPPSYVNEATIQRAIALTTNRIEAAGREGFDENKATEKLDEAIAALAAASTDPTQFAVALELVGEAYREIGKFEAKVCTCFDKDDDDDRKRDNRVRSDNDNDDDEDFDDDDGKDSGECDDENDDDGNNGSKNDDDK